MTAPAHPEGPCIVLASASPRRRDLLSRAGLRFEVAPVPGDEPTVAPGEGAAAFARRAATWKAVAAARLAPGRLVLGADTVVALHDEVMGKPLDPDDARRMLALLSGREHEVHTAVACALADTEGQVRARCELVTTHVAFRTLTPAEIDEYVSSREPLDKAGAYGIQGLGGDLVDRYNGSYSNVVGLPVEETLSLLQACHETWLDEPAPRWVRPRVQPRLPLGV
jgi:septum formation protein